MSHSTSFASTPQLQPRPSFSSENTKWLAAAMCPPSKTLTTAPSLGENSSTVPRLVAAATTVFFDSSLLDPLPLDSLLRFFALFLTFGGSNPQANELTDMPFSKTCSQRSRPVFVSCILSR